MNPEVLSIIINIISSLFYDGIRFGGLHIFPDFKGKLTDKNIKEEVVKSVTKELENKVIQSKIFDCDAMHNYIKYMQPIQEIYQHVFLSDKNAGISTDELLSRLQSDTRKYLLEQGKNVDPLEESEIGEFYNSVVKICDEVSYSLLNHEDIALARLLNRETENSQKTILSEINRNSERIRSEISSQSDMIGQTLQKVNELVTNTSETFTVAAPKQAMLEAAPYKYIGGSEKRQFVKKLTSDLRKCQWIHIYGKMFTGKTQTLIRVAEHLAFCIWVTIKDDEFQKVSIKELDLQEDTVVIIDGIPNMAKPGTVNKCMQILSECKEKKCKLITTGYEDAEVYAKGFVTPDELISVELTGLTEDEVEEIMRNHDAPEGLFHSKGFHSFVELCKEFPPVVMEVVHRMEANGWKYDDDVFTTILTRRTESIEEQMKHLFLDAVDDEEARRLYYRIIYANRAIEKNWIPSIVAIPEKISQPDKNMEILRNRWVYADGKLYRCPNKVLQNYAEEQLSQSEKTAINEFLIKEIKKHSLEPLDVSDLFLYYTRLENFDAQGILCYQIMEQMIENDVKDYLVNVEMFWQEMPLPEKMSSFIKVIVRAQQLYYRIWRGDTIKNIEAQRAELWSLASDDECKVLVTVFGIKFAIIDAALSLLFFEDFLTICGGTFHIPDGLQKMIDEAEAPDIPDVLLDNSAFSIYNSTLGLYIGQLADLELYIDIMDKYFTTGQWREIEDIENIDAIILCMLEKVSNNSEGNLERYLNAVQRFYSMLNKEKTPILWKSVLHSYLLGYQKLQDYEGAKSLYDSVESILKENSVDYLEVIDVMARIAHDNNDYELEKRLFKWEMQVILQDEGVAPNRVMIDSCLLYLDKLDAEERQEIEHVHQVMRYVACNIEPQAEYPLLLERLEAEYWMKIYLIGALETEMLKFLSFVEQLLEAFSKHDSIAIKSVLTKMCHVLGYISGKFLRNSAPEKFPDGSDYASPKLRMFWNDVEDTEVISYWNPDKIEMMYYICAALGDKYGLYEFGNRIFRKMISNQNFWNKTLECMYRVESYLPMKFLEQNELNKLVYFMQKSYEPQERNEIEKNGEYYFIVREQMIISIFILQVYQKSVSSAMKLCEQLVELIDENQYDELGKKYYKEYKQVLRLLVKEEADFDLLKEAFFLIQKKPELTSMDSGVFPLLLLRTPSNQKEKLKANVVKCMKKFHFDNDFVMARYIKMIESDCYPDNGRTGKEAG
ncbi:MAG: hypothetical protein ACI4S2_06735 [Lachnospiraceae bacterium]